MPFFRAIDVYDAVTMDFVDGNPTEAANHLTGAEALGDGTHSPVRERITNLIGYVTDRTARNQMAQVGAFLTVYDLIYTIARGHILGRLGKATTAVSLRAQGKTERG